MLVSRRRGLQIKEHPVLGIYVKDLQEIVVADDAKLTELMDRGNKSRAVRRISFLSKVTILARRCPNFPDKKFQDSESYFFS